MYLKSKLADLAPPDFHGQTPEFHCETPQFHGETPEFHGESHQLYAAASPAIMAQYCFKSVLV